MTRFILLMITTVFATIVTSNAQRPPEDFLLKEGEQKIPVLLVGTFHFRYPGLDSHKTSEEDKIDVLSPKRQREIRELVDYIARFKPTKIVVEAGRNTGYLMQRYERWQEGTYDLQRREIDQLAFPLMKQFGLDTLYGCDAPSLLWSLLHSKDSTALKPIVARYYEAEAEEDPMGERYFDWYDYTDQYALNNTMLETFRDMNSEHHIKTMHGHYIVDGFKSGEFEGADGLAMNWYSRNLRIFRRIQMIDADQDDRIMVLFGAGHMAILMQQFEASPEYEIVPFHSLSKLK
jgi:hypothetical protein